ncbi:hypothetical protein QBC35DRAFT_536070 [Podospora australis]|uniref:Uncharacterized protein n=1 Tax=Podospora australis TaxID=1536484 RepID=A0AAN6WMR9_9PEZI|nr:hypothetical protein QBC35DRAFT_536070 [Podospora australis]
MIGGPRYPKDLESQARRAEENEQSLSQQQFHDRRGVSDAAKLARAQAWAEWTNFSKHILKIDPDETILDLCRAPPKQAAAKLQCQKFLKHYIESSERQRPTLGPEGVVWVLTVTSATTVLDMWKSLIMYAETNVLQEMRNRDPENREQWTLGVENKGPRGKGPTFEISTWIGEVLTKEYNLITRQKFEKHEATDEEILVILNIIWHRPNLIPCDPDTWVDVTALA